MQIYKLFYNYNFIEVIKKTEVTSLEGNFLYYNQIKSVSSVIDNFIATKQNMVIICDMLKQAEMLLKDIKQCFTFQKAAGGIVCSKNKILAIERLGKWDLPKGHVEQGETDTQTAIREVQEETGIQHLKILQDAGFTYHIFPQDGCPKLVLKQTHWYTMQNTPEEQATPQTEEHITRVTWLDKSDLQTFFNNTYPSISLLLETCFNKHFL
ncbi:MAG: NUDIX domain-containing protein [Bacteroidales bacterium]|nr:NUDIX domain-containing protein [Bacteroidales bacterium]